MIKVSQYRQSLNHIFQDLESKKDELLVVLDSKTSLIGQGQPPVSGWNLLEVTNHLYLVEHYAMTQFENNRHRKIKKPLWDHFRFQMVRFALSRPIKVKVPVKDVDPVEAVDVAVLKKEWTELRQKVKTEMMALTDEDLRFCFFHHPYAGYFSFDEGLQFLIWHWEHHQKQIGRLLVQLS